MPLNGERMRFRTCAVRAEYVCRVETQIDVLRRQTDILVIGITDIRTSYTVRVGFADIGLFGLVRLPGVWRRLCSARIVRALGVCLILAADWLPSRCLGRVGCQVGTGYDVCCDVAVVVYDKLRLLCLLAVCRRVRRSRKGVWPHHRP